jgi:hypothetical protein
MGPKLSKIIQEYYKSNRKQGSASYGIESEADTDSKCEWPKCYSRNFKRKDEIIFIFYF